MKRDKKFPKISIKKDCFFFLSFILEENILKILIELQ